MWGAILSRQPYVPPKKSLQVFASHLGRPLYTVLLDLCTGIVHNLHTFFGPHVIHIGEGFMVHRRTLCPLCFPMLATSLHTTYTSVGLYGEKWREFSGIETYTSLTCFTQ